MYRIILLISICAAGIEACRPPPCHWKDARPIEKYFEDAARELIAAERKIQRNCYNHGVSRIKNVFGDTEFKFVIPAAGYNKGDFSVKTKNRVMYISGANCERSFTDVRIIPDYFDVHRSNWIYEDKELIITMPYLFGSKYGSRQKTCDDINEATLIVPMAPLSEFEDD